MDIEKIIECFITDHIDTKIYACSDGSEFEVDELNCTKSELKYKLIKLIEDLSN